MNPAEYEAMYRVEDTHWWYVGMRAIVRAMVGDRLDAAGCILDAGCGTGGTLAWWCARGTARGHRVVGAGIDFSPNALAFGMRRGLTRLGRASVSDLPFADRTFDGVLSLDVIYHLGVADDRHALAELARVTRPGGWACVRVPAFDSLRSAHDVAVHTRERYRLATLAERIAQAGFVVNRATYANALLFPAAVASRLLRRGIHDNAQAGESDRSVASDVHPSTAIVQAIGNVALRAEAALLRVADLPFGLSAVVVATRPLDAA
jgi:SAM-dependent methyltransferase